MSIKERIKEIIVNTLDLDVNIKDFPDENVIELYGINSVDTLEILLNIEEEYDMQVDDEDLNIELVNSINNLADYVEAKLKEKGQE